jgi:hypothetical protein
MDEDYATTTLPPPLKLGITVTSSLCITAAHCGQSTNFSNGPRKYAVKIWTGFNWLKTAPNDGSF